MGDVKERSGLAGKKAIVVGGAFGLGRAVTLALAESGVDVAFCDNDADALPETLALAEKTGVSVLAKCFDALDIPALQAFYDEAGKRFGHLDIVVNVVGGAHMKPFDESGPDDWTYDIHRNFGYVIHSTKAALPWLRKSGRGGSIVNFTTIEAHRGAATIAVYAGAKAATTNFSRAIATELGHEGIRVNTVASDMTPTRGNIRARNPRSSAGRQALPPEVIAKAVAIATPMGEPPTLDDVANGVLFLASDLAHGVTGTVLHVDGGTFGASGFNRWPHDEAFAPMPMANTLRRIFHDEIPAA